MECFPHVWRTSHFLIVKTLEHQRSWGDCLQEIAQDADGKDFQPEDSGAPGDVVAPTGTVGSHPAQWLVSPSGD